jgi:hypothetical protein
MPLSSSKRSYLFGQLKKKVFIALETFIITFTKVLPPDLFWATSFQLNPVHAFTSCSAKFRFNIILFCVYLPQSDLYPSGLQTKLCMNAFLHTSYRLRSFRLINFNTLKVQGEEYPSSRHFIFPRSKHFRHFSLFKHNHIYDNDERYQLDATIYLLL